MMSSSVNKMVLFYACEVICKGVGDLATVGGLVLVVTTFWPLPDSFMFARLGN
jgi:hypothetical protein